MLLRASSEPLCTTLFAPPAAAEPGARRGGSKFRGVVLAFAADLDDLLRLVTASHTHFVRCVKPVPRACAHARMHARTHAHRMRDPHIACETRTTC